MALWPTDTLNAHIVIDRLSFGWLGVNGMRVFAVLRRVSVCIDATGHQYLSSLNAIIAGFIIFYSCLKLCFGWFASLFVSLRWDRESVQSLLLNSLPRIALLCGLTHLILFVLVVFVICIWRRSFEHELFNVSAVNKRYLFCVKLEHELIRPQTTTLRERKTSIQTRKSFYYSLRCLLLWFVQFTLNNLIKTQI